MENFDHPPIEINRPPLLNIPTLKKKSTQDLIKTMDEFSFQQLIQTMESSAKENLFIHYSKKSGDNKCDPMGSKKLEENGRSLL
jgi:hypothetical protein